MKLKKAYKYLKDDLNTIEQALNKAIQAEHPILREASTQLLKAGGKRIRPVFVLLASQMGHFDIKQVEKVAVSLERSEEHTSELQSRFDIVSRLLLDKKHNKS